eukprot:3310682-Alexandrium_andersonii.AAC.1
MRRSLQTGDTSAFWTVWPSALQKALEHAQEKLGGVSQPGTQQRAGGAKKGTPKVVTTGAYEVWRKPELIGS